MKKQLIPAVVLLVVAMFACAEYTGETEIIFPEIIALALGAWVATKPPWGAKFLHLWLSPTMAAVTGMAMIKIFPYSPLLMITGAFILVVIELKLIKSDVLPSLSAAILPIIVQANSWYYPLAVCILTLIIALGKKILAGFHSKQQKENLAPKYSANEVMSGEVRQEIIHWAKLLAGVVVISAVALASHWLYMVAPPLIVAFVELSKPNGHLQAKAGQVFTVLVISAFLGVGWLYLIHYLLHWPVWIAAVITTASVFLLFGLMRLPFPPAAAIALLPTIIPVASLSIYPVQVLLGSAAFILVSLVWFKDKDSSSAFRMTA